MRRNRSIRTTCLQGTNWTTYYDNKISVEVEVTHTVSQSSLFICAESTR